MENTGLSFINHYWKTVTRNDQELLLSPNMREKKAHPLITGPLLGLSIFSFTDFVAPKKHCAMPKTL
jgi:hypothetical protein